MAAYSARSAARASHPRAVTDELKDAASSAELWRQLQSDAGLQAEDYDEPLVHRLHESLGLRGSGSTEQELAEHDISVERFVAAFFEAVYP
jgi:hypothetical protein